MRRPSTYFLTLGFLTLVSADWQYASRPDLSPPKLNITIPASSASGKGYLFLAPYEGFSPGHQGPVQDGPHIYRDDGELVWSGVGYFGGWVMNFRPDIWQGQPVLRAFQGQLKPQGRMYGNYAILNMRYETIRTFRPKSVPPPSGHEFLLVNGTTVLIETPIPRVRDLSRYGGNEEQRWIRSATFQEVDLETGKVLFNWESLDHVDPQYSALPLIGPKHLDGRGPYNGEGYNSTDAWNYFHINSVDKNEEGDYLISARCYSAIFKISGKTGKVLWQLGGGHGRSSFTVDDDASFAYQHDARFVSRNGHTEVISLHDNSAFNSPQVALRNCSTARYIEIDHTSRTAKSLRAFPAPYGITGASQGNVQSLPNGNTFVNWGQGGAITEYTDDGQVVFHAFLDSEPSRHVQSYRGFRFDWVGRPSEPPAIVATRRKQGVTRLYVSWNGDTVVKTWQFRVSYQGKEVELGRPRNGFETSASYDGPVDWVYAVAFNKDGREVGRTRSVVPEDRPSTSSIQPAVLLLQG